MKNFALLGVSIVALAHSASGAITLTLSGTSGSSLVSYAFSGSGVSASTLTTSEIVITNVGDIFDVGVASGDKIYTVSSTFTNTTDEPDTDTAISQFIIDQDTSIGSDDFEIQFASPISFAIGEAYSLSGSGIVDLVSAGLTFDDLNVGSYSNVGDFDDGTWSGVNLVINTVPEPSSTMLVGLGGLALLVRRRRS